MMTELLPAPLISMDMVNLLVLKPVLVCWIGFWLFGYLKYQSAYLQKYMLRILLLCLLFMSLLGLLIPPIELPIVPNLLNSGAVDAPLWMFGESSIWAVLLIVYVCGVLYQLVKLAIDLLALSRLTNNSVVFEREEWPDWLAGCLGAAGVSPQIKVMTESMTPAVWGFVSPTLLLPENFLALSSERQKQIVLHEANHIRRHDWLLLILGRLCCCAFWHIPWVWTLQRMLVETTEGACDNSVLDAGHSSYSYAKTLIDTLKSHHRQYTTLALISKPFLFRRTEAILDQFAPREAPSLAMRAGIGLLGVFFTVSIGLAKVTVFEMPAEVSSIEAISLSVGDYTDFSSSAIEKSPSDGGDEYVGIHQLRKWALVASDAEALPVTSQQQFGLPDIASMNHESQFGSQDVETFRFSNPPVFGGGRYKPVKTVLPVYPQKAIAKHKQGRVVVGYEVSGNGSVDYPRIISASPAGYFEDAALHAIRQFEFDAIPKEAPVVPGFITSTFVFSLSGRGKTPTVAAIFYSGKPKTL